MRILNFKEVIDEFKKLINKERNDIKFPEDESWEEFLMRRKGLNPKLQDILDKASRIEENRIDK